jgi:hypothetical protein
VAVDEDDRVPAGVEGLGSLLTREACVVRQVAVAVVVGTRVTARPTLHEQDPFVTRLESELRIGVITRLWQDGRIRRTAVAAVDDLAAERLIRKGCRRGSASNLHGRPLDAVDEELVRAIRVEVLVGS